MNTESIRSQPPRWYSFGYSVTFMFRRKRLLGWSLLLFLATIGITSLGYNVSISYVDMLAGNFLVAPPAPETILGWLQIKLWGAGSWLFLVITRIVAFYLAFLVAYCITTPGYAFLSTATEKLHAGEKFDADLGFSLGGILIDMLEGAKIAVFGGLVTILALLVNFIPIFGQIIVFLLYTFYSALMFIDFPASRRRWSLGRKLDWLRENSGKALRLGLLPAMVSMVPLLNIFCMSLLFPLLTIHSTLNFSSIEVYGLNPADNQRGRKYGSGDRTKIPH